MIPDADEPYHTVDEKDATNPKQYPATGDNPPARPPPHRRRRSRGYTIRRWNRGPLGPD